MTTGGQVILTVLSIFATACLAVLGWIGRKVLTHDSALAVLVHEVNPPDKPSLRDMLTTLNNQHSTLSTQIAVLTDRNERKDHTP